MDERGVSSVVGVVLVLGISLAAVTAIVAVGGTLVDDARNDAETSQMENSMSQFSSKASLVGLGDSSNQQFSLGRTSSGSVDVREDAGWVALRIESQEWNGTFYNETYGAVVYQNGDTEVAYQGGGVWRKQGGASRMVSPPEYHYRGETLTFPILRVSGDDAAGGDVRGSIHSLESDRPIYPDPDNSILSNPLENGTIYVTVHSEYCGGWQAFFEERSEGSIAEDCGDNNTVEVDLTVPFDEAFSDEIIATEAYEPKGKQKGEGPSVNVSNRPSVSPVVESRIEDCEDNGCSDFLSGESSIDDGEYYASEDTEFNDLTFDTSSGGIDIIIDGDLDIGGNNKIDGGGEVRIFLNGEYDLNGNINQGGMANQTQIYVHSDAEEINHRGDTHFTGLTYAPNTKIEQRGGGFIKGAIVGSTVSVRGDPSNDFEYDEALKDFSTNLPMSETSIKFLHVTEETVEIRLN